MSNYSLVGVDTCFAEGITLFDSDRDTSTMSSSPEDKTITSASGGGPLTPCFLLGELRPLLGGLLGPARDDPSVLSRWMLSGLLVGVVDVLSR